MNLAEGCNYFRTRATNRHFVSFKQQSSTTGGDERFSVGSSSSVSVQPQPAACRRAIDVDGFPLPSNPGKIPPPTLGGGEPTHPFPIFHLNFLVMQHPNTS